MTDIAKTPTTTATAHDEPVNYARQFERFALLLVWAILIIGFSIATTARYASRIDTTVETISRPSTSRRRSAVAVRNATDACCAT